jgi:hypothetical protein
LRRVGTSMEKWRMRGLKLHTCTGVCAAICILHVSSLTESLPQEKKKRQKSVYLQYCTLNLYLYEISYY